jgi:hypothetical protein
MGVHTNLWPLEAYSSTGRHDIHFSDAFVDLGLLRQQFHFTGSQLQHPAFSGVGDLLLPHDQELLFGKSLLLADFLQNLHTVSRCSVATWTNCTCWSFSFGIDMMASSSLSWWSCTLVIACCAVQDPRSASLAVQSSGASAPERGHHVAAFGLDGCQHQRELLRVRSTNIWGIHSSFPDYSQNHFCDMI